MRRVSALVFVVAVVLVGLVAAGRLPATVAQEATRPAAGGDVAAVDPAFKAAFAAGDLDAIDRLVAAGAVEVNPFGVFRGPAEIRAFSEQLGRANPGLAVAVGDTQVVENTAVHRVEITSDPIRQAGVEHIVVIHTLVVYRGKILTLTAVFDLDDPETARFAAQVAGGTPAASPSP